MIYVISDIHGCYNEYIKLLEKINFSDDDELFVLGDVVDRGPEPIKVLQDMMMRPNVYPILGNHDYMALTVLEKMCVEITEENVESHLTGADMTAMLHWQSDGGNTTIQEFRKLSMEEKQDILEYLQEFSLYEEVVAGGKKYVLVHADLHGFAEDKSLDEYALHDLIFYRADYERRYFQDKNVKLITGHTPTFTFRDDQLPLVYKGNGHVAIDCGCVYGKKLAAFCLDDECITYVDSTQS